jgi:hypothetical protein
VELDESDLERVEGRIDDALLRIADQCLRIQRLRDHGHTAPAEQGVQLLALLKRGLRELRSDKQIILRELRRSGATSAKSRSSSARRAHSRLRRARDAQELIGAVADIMSGRKRN